MQLISDTPSLERFCDILTRADTDRFIAVDTEFVRTTTYWSQLCLVQVAGSSTRGLIDPLAPEIDLSALRELFRNPKILKVFHSAWQDLEIFFHLWGELPQPVFDTQIAAMVCGYGDSVGFDRLAQAIVYKTLDKSCQFTDWARRPLSEQQKEYALQDVVYLRPIYQAIQQKLSETGRVDWIAEEMAVLQDPNTYAVDIETVWKRIKTRSIQPRFLARLKELAKARELEARRRNRARQHILKDQILIELAACPPGDLKAFNHIKGLPTGFEKSRLGRNLWQGLQNANKIPLDQCPQPQIKPVLKPWQESLMDLLQLWLKIVARQAKVTPKLVATKQDLQDLVCDVESESRLMNGWRYELFGQDAMDLISGTKVITFSKDRHRLTLEPKQ